MENLPSYIALMFGFTTVATLLLFIQTLKSAASPQTRGKSLKILVGLLLWLAIQAALTLQGVYSSDMNSFPPKIMLTGIFPMLAAIVLLFITSGGRKFIDSLPLKNLTYLHVVRVPVEIVLYWLFLHKAVPELMTFEGRNFDILAGLTAPFIAYFGLTTRQISRQIVLTWNFICLGLLINIVAHALFSTPSPVQKFAFDQPNIAIFYFPFSWLPTFIVPLVLFGHLVAIRQLVKYKATSLPTN